MSGTQDRTILIVEDDEAIRETLGMALELKGYRVVSAPDGRAGLETLKDMCRRRARPHLILLDLMMPVMDGWEFAAALARDERLRDIPVVVLTAIQERAGEVIARQIIRKPVDLPVLYAAVERWSGTSA